MKAKINGKWVDIVSVGPVKNLEFEKIEEIKPVEMPVEAVDSVEFKMTKARYDADALYEFVTGQKSNGEKYMDEDSYIEEKRKQAKEILPKLQKVIEAARDKELCAFVQEVVDDYMCNVCKLGRKRSLVKE